MSSRAPAVPERRNRARRQADDMRAWAPVILSILSTIVALTIAYGRISSRLDMIEYRLMKLEERIATGKVSP